MGPALILHVGNSRTKWGLHGPRGWLAQFAENWRVGEKAPADVIATEVRTVQHLLFDRQHLDQVMWNLVRNAWRHGTRTPGSIRTM